MSGLWAGVALVFFAKSAIPQVTLGDLGVREGAAVFFLGAYGVAPAAALDASLALCSLLNLVLPSLAGTPLLLRLLRLPARRVPGHPVRRRGGAGVTVWGARPGRRWALTYVARMARLGRRLPPRGRPRTDCAGGARPTMALPGLITVVVPARNEEGSIGRVRGLGPGRRTTRATGSR